MFSLPIHPQKIYAAVGHCIYCGGNKALSDEHIVPLGLGGRRVLPKSSCGECAKKTGAFERTCQRTMYGPLRMYYDLPSRRRKERPATLPLKVKLTPDADWSFIDANREVYPFLVLLSLLQMPDELSGQTTEGERGAKGKASVDSRRLISRRYHPSYGSVGRRAKRSRHRANCHSQRA